MSETDSTLGAMRDLYRACKGSALTTQEEQKIKREVDKAKRLRSTYDTICREYNVGDDQVKQLYAWELTVALDEKKFYKAEALIGILKATGSKS